MNRPGAGIALIVLTAATFALLDPAAKRAGALLPMLVVLLSRYGVQATTMGLWLAHSNRRPGGAGFRSAHPRFQLARAVLLLTSSTFAFFGLQHMPVAEFTAINMLTPVVVTLMAGWFLHERVSRLRWALVCGGLVGALIVIRPGSGLFGWGVLLPVAGMLCYASFQLLTSKLAALENPFTTHFYTGLIGTALVSAALLASGLDLGAALRDSTPAELAILPAIGVLGTLGHLMLVLAFGMAPTATLMPFVYTQIGFAALIGWLVFRQVPDGWGWLGIGVVAASGAASAWLNLRSKAAAREPVSAFSIDTTAD